MSMTFINLSSGMNYLHNRKPPILHRDLSSRNVLLSDNVAKIADFGLSKEKRNAYAKVTNSTGALGWLAPEVASGTHEFTEAADVYSYGM